MSRRRRILFFLAILLLGVYLYPAPRPTFTNLYAKAPGAKAASLQAFRAEIPVQTLRVGRLAWQYVAVGEASQTVLFLHGMTGSYDIWWQQMEALRGSYRVIAVTYPAAKSLEELERGVLAILEREGIDRFSVVGSSLGGYFAQYLVAKHPERIEKAVFSNTFPPNDLILQQNGAIGGLIPYLPEWLVMSVLRASFEQAIYPASGNDELTLAFLNELSYGRVSRAQVAGRYRCVVEKFDPPVQASTPILIIEASNDPLVAPELRNQLRATYPGARVVTVDNGHFPYLGMPDFYTQTLVEFLGP